MLESELRQGRGGMTF